MSSFDVVSADGTRLAVRQRGNPDGPAIVLVHGFPDDSSLWDKVVSLLADDFRLITYDVRGAGQSQRPAQTAAYRLERLAEDLEAVGVDEKTHLVAHDWGSIQVWYALGAGLKAASFTSISGPDLGRAQAWMRAHRRSRQTVKSSYILLFRIPLIAEALSKTRLLQGFIKLVDSTHRGHPIRHADVRYGLKLYRANMFRPLPSARTTTPAQILAPSRDPFVGKEIQSVEGVPLHTVRDGHWLPLSDPGYVAGRTREFISEIMSRAD